MVLLLGLILLILLLLVRQLGTRLRTQQSLRQEMRSLKRSRAAAASGIIRLVAAELAPPQPLSGQARYLVLDTEAMELIDGTEAEGDFVSPLFALSWQLLDAAGQCLREESYMLRQTGERSEALRQLQQVSEPCYRAEAITPREALERLSRVLQPQLTLVGHHLAYHLRQLQSEAERQGIPLPLIDQLPQRCLMQEGLRMGFKRGYDDSPRYPSAEELFRYLHHLGSEPPLPPLRKALRDLRLGASSLRVLLSWEQTSDSGAPPPSYSPQA